MAEAASNPRMAEAVIRDCESRGQPLPAELQAMARARKTEKVEVEPTPKERPAYWPYRSQLEVNRAEYHTHRATSGLIRGWQYEPLSLALVGAGAKRKKRYTPDFLVWENDGAITLEELKGSWRAKNQRDARTRLEVAADRHPWARFVAVTRDAAGWHEEEISA